MEHQAQTPPAEVGWRNFPPMWSITPAVLRSNTENVTFSMDLTHIDPVNTENAALQAQCPMRYFKASTVLQGMLHGSDCIENLAQMPSADEETLATKDILPQHTQHRRLLRHAQPLQRPTCPIWSSPTSCSRMCHSSHLPHEQQEPEASYVRMCQRA